MGGLGTLGGGGGAGGGGAAGAEPVRATCKHGLDLQEYHAPRKVHSQPALRYVHSMADTWDGQAGILSA